MISFRHFVTSTFTDLSFFKRWMIRGSVLLVVVGLGAMLISSQSNSESGSWSWTSIQSGLGYIGGFLIGALIRMFFKLSLVVIFVIAAASFGLAKLGWIDLPYQEVGEMTSALGEAVGRQLSGLQTFLSGFLPASVMSGMGVASGVTQRPDWTP